MMELLPFRFEVENAIVGASAVSAILAVVAVWHALVERDPMRHRIKALQVYRDSLKHNITAARRSPHRQHSMRLMNRVINALNLLKSDDAIKAKRTLSQAGWRSREALVGYFFARLCTPFAFGAAGLFLPELLGFKNVTLGLEMGFAIGGVVLGAMAPSIYVGNTAKKRSNLIRKGLPDALDLLVICAEAGQGIDAALQRVAREMATVAPALAEELELTVLELGMLPERRQALEHLTYRVDLSTVRALVNTLSQTEKYGTPLVESLRVLAAELRNERLMRAEEKAARLPAIMTVPMIIFILPPLFVVLIGPSVVRVIDMFRQM